MGPQVLTAVTILLFNAFSLFLSFSFDSSDFRWSKTSIFQQKKMADKEESIKQNGWKHILIDEKKTNEKLEIEKLEIEKLEHGHMDERYTCSRSLNFLRRFCSCNLSMQSRRSSISSLTLWTDSTSCRIEDISRFMSLTCHYRTTTVVANF